MGLDWGPVLLSVDFFHTVQPWSSVSVAWKSKAVEFGGF